MNQPVVVEGVASLQIIGLRAVCLLVSFDPEAGAFPTTIHCRWVDMAAAPLSSMAGGGKSNLEYALF